MGVKRGLSIDGINYLSDVVSGKQKPDWMQIGTEVGKITGHYEIANFLSGYKNMEQFLFRTPQWPIGGMYFDGIMRSEHVSRVRPTNYPVQTGVTMTDHAIIEPVELTIEIMMTDSSADSYMNLSPVVSGVLRQATGVPIIGGVVQNAVMPVVDTFLQSAPIVKKIYDWYSNFRGLPKMPDIFTSPGENRSIAVWKSLRSMQLSRVPITVETRLQTYHNMLIEELSAPDDVNTLHALRCTVRLREIIFASVAETAVSTRASASAGESSSGQTPVQTGDDVNKTAARAILDAGGSILA